MESFNIYRISETAETYTMLAQNSILSLPP